MIRQSRLDRHLAFCIFLLCANLIFIWGNSLLPGEVSGSFSGAIKTWLLSLFPGLGSGSSDGGHHLLRKLAHFLEFCCLGICLSCLVRRLQKKAAQQLLLPWVGGVLAACADEAIQSFIPDRGPAIKDVGIDTLGVTLGVGIISMIYYLKEKKTTQEKMEENQS